MPIPSHSFHLTLTPSGIVNSRFPDGNDGSTAIPLVWGSVPSTLLNQEGTPVSINLRAYLTEPGSPSATLSIVGNLPAGWSLVGDNLTFGGTGQGLATVQVRAVRGTVTVDSNFFTVESIPSAAADNQAPTATSTLTALISTSPPQVTLQWDAASDVKTPAVTASLMKDYIITRNGVAMGASPLVSPPGISVQLTQNTIGAPNPAVSSYSQSGPDYAFTIGGDTANIGGTSDSLHYVAAKITGNFTIIAEVDLTTGPVATAKAGLMVRASLAADAPFVHLVKFPDSGTNGVALQSRSTVGGAVASVPQTNLTGKRYLRLQRSGSSFTGSYWTGSSWVALSTVTIGMTDPVYVGVAGNSGASGSTISPVFRQVNIQNLAVVTLIDTGVSLGGTYNYTVQARDGANNTAAAVGVTAILPASTAKKKPILMLMAIGGTQRYDGDFTTAWGPLFDYIVIGGDYDSAGPSMQGGSRDAVVNAIKANTNADIGTKIYQYIITDHIEPTPRSVEMANVVTANNWFLYANGTSGTIVSNQSASGWKMVNPTLAVPADAATGLKAEARFWKYVGERFLTAGGAQAAPALDGVYRDNSGFNAEQVGDYNRDGSSDAITPDTATANQAVRDGIANGIDWFHANYPGKEFLGNHSSLGVSGTSGLVSTGISGKFDGGFGEATWGKTYSMEYWGTFDLVKQHIQFCLNAYGGAKRASVAALGINSNGSDNQTSTPWQAMRYMFATTLMDEVAFAANATAYIYTERLYLDEWAVSAAGVATPYGSSPFATVKANRKWIGTPTDAPWSSLLLTVGGTNYRVYYRRHLNDNGQTVLAIVNPKGNATVTVNIAAAFGKSFKAITGFQDPSVNNGATSSTITLLARDARIGFLV